MDKLKLELIEEAEKAMGIEASASQIRPDLGSEHDHVAIAWRGGVIWLDMSVQSDHYCVDVRQFVPASVQSEYDRLLALGWSQRDAARHTREMERMDAQPDSVELAGQGVFTIVNGRQQSLCSPAPAHMAANPVGMEQPLKDPDGTPVRGHGWNGGYVVTLMHDKVPSERQTNRPAGSGRG